MEEISKQDHKRLQIFKGICLNLDPFNELDRKKIIQQLQELGIKLEQTDPFYLSNLLLTLIDQEGDSDIQSPACGHTHTH